MNFDIVTKLFKKSSSSHVKILIIDDGEVDQKVACSAIERGGYTAISAFDGGTGIASAKENLPDLIILDFNLPDGKGPDICRALKADAKTAHIPILFLTSVDTPDSIMDCYKEGGENYLSKPINPNFLLDQIRHVLQDKKK